MSRTLHIIDQPGEVAEAVVLRLSVDAATLEEQTTPGQHAWLLFGSEATRDAARAIGLHDRQYRLLPKPVGLHKLLPAALAKPRQLINEAHRVVCWTEGATQIASLLGCAHVARRVEDTRLCDFAKAVIACALSTPGNDATTRDSLRERWGVEEGTSVVALLGDRLDRTDASAAMMTIALTHEALRASQPVGADVRLLCHPKTWRRAEASELSALLSIDHLLIQDEGALMPWSVLHACDAALAPAPGEAGLSILWADGLDLPVITPGDAQLPMLDTIEQRIAARSSKPRDLADALTNWVRSRSASLQPAG